MKNLELLRQLAPIVHRLDRKTRVKKSDLDFYEITRTANNIKSRGDCRDLDEIIKCCIIGWITETGAFQLLNSPAYYDFSEIPDRVLVHKSPQETWKDRSYDLSFIQELDFDETSKSANIWRVEVKTCAKYQLGNQFCFNDKKDSNYDGINLHNFLKSQDTELIFLMNQNQTEDGWDSWCEAIIHRRAFEELPKLPSDYAGRLPQFYYWWHDLIDNNLAIRLNIDARFSNSDF